MFVEIAIVKGSIKHLTACTEALTDSAIGSAYFASAEKAEAFLHEGLTKGEVYVALDQAGNCLGYIWFTLGGAFYKFPYVLNIAIRKDCRKKGIGKQLLSFFEGQGFVKASRLFLLVSDFNAEAQIFYRDLGYEEVGRIPDLVREGVTEHIMMKKRP
jgi:ribosomal protein S18 acetylase RimI-like enzyme